MTKSSREKESEKKAEKRVAARRAAAPVKKTTSSGGVKSPKVAAAKPVAAKPAVAASSKAKPVSARVEKVSARAAAPKPRGVIATPGERISAADRETFASEEVPRDFVDAIPLSSSGNVAAPLANQLETIGKKLEQVLAEVGVGADPELRRRAASALSELATRLAPTFQTTSLGDGHESDSFVARSDYADRQWGRGALRSRSEAGDEFGLDPAFESSVARFFEALYRSYFRVTTTGLDRIDDSGRTLIVANHSGTFPWDGVMLKTAIALDHASHRELRWLIEDFIFHTPFVGAFMNRIGAVRACQENAERLLLQDKLTAVFPEGIQGMGKLFKQRYRLQRFGRGGYIKLALRTGARIVPTAIVGAEEANPLLFKVGGIVKALDIPYFPITPTFPFLGPLGLVPLPSKWSITFGEPIDLSEFPPEAAQDAILVNRLNERVRGTIQSMVDDAVAARNSAFLG